MEDLWSPGALKWTLKAGDVAHFVCSTGPVTVSGALEGLKGPVERAVEVRVKEIVRDAGKVDPEVRVGRVRTEC